MEKVKMLLRQKKVVPVIVPTSEEQLDMVLSALCEGGLAVAEITFRTENAPELLAYCVKKYGTQGILIGAGTVINATQAKQAIEAGAQFVVGPGLSFDVADVCAGAGVLYIPGCCTPTEIIAALDKGINLIKIFPANIYGGLEGIKALSAAFPGVEFMPTGGVTAQNLEEYLSFKKIVACGGSFMAKGGYADIVEGAKKAVQTAQGMGTVQ